MVQQNLCMKCSYVISDPVCTKCYLREFVIWLNEKDIPLQKRNVLMRLIKRTLMSEGTHGQMCILCEKEDTSLCSYCFFMGVEGFLEGLDVEDSVIASFMESFNYEIPTIDKRQLEKGEIYIEVLR